MSNEQALREEVAQLVRKATGPNNGDSLPLAEVERLLLAERERALRLQQERDDLQRQLKETEEERKGFERAAYTLLREKCGEDHNFEIPPEEDRVLLTDLIKECEEMIRHQ